MSDEPLRAVFVGSQNLFDECLIHWLSQRLNVVGVVWTRSTEWQATWKGRWKHAKKRFRRYGLFKLLDETLFYLCYHRFFNARSERELYKNVIQPYVEEHAVRSWQGDALATHNVNSSAVREFLEQRRPDIVFAMCTNDFFGRRLRAIPRYGVFLWHEGITPEYKGLYAPFWAAHNLDFERIGYTLLKMNDDLDAGEIFVQGKATDVDPCRHTHDYMGHKAIFDSLPQVERFLTALRQGTAQPIDRSDAVPRTYTYPGVSDLIRQRIRLRSRAKSQLVQGS